MRILFPSLRLYAVLCLLGGPSGYAGSTSGSPDLVSPPSQNPANNAPPGRSVSTPVYSGSSIGQRNGEIAAGVAGAVGAIINAATQSSSHSSDPAPSDSADAVQAVRERIR